MEWKCIFYVIINGQSIEHVLPSRPSGGWVQLWVWGYVAIVGLGILVHDLRLSDETSAKRRDLDIAQLDCANAKIGAIKFKLEI